MTSGPAARASLSLPPSSPTPFSPSKNARWVRCAITLATCLLLFLLDLSRPALLEHFDENIRDVFVRALADSAPEERVLVVNIDDKSLRELGEWPWPRSRIADLVEILMMDYQARAVGLDIVFPEARDKAGDDRLAMLARHGPLALAQVFDFAPRVPRLSQGQIAPPSLDAGKTPSVAAFGYIANHPRLSEEARCVGNIGYIPASDGVLRHTPLFAAYEGREYPQFALALAYCAAASGAAAPDAAWTKLPRPRANGQWRIPFRHATEAYTVIPASEVLALTAPRALIEGRHVIVGSSSLGLGDRVSTPLNPLVSGVFVHAQSVSALLDRNGRDDLFSRHGRAGLLVYALLSILLAVYGIARLTAWSSTLFLVGLSALWLGLAFFGVARQVEHSVIIPLIGYFVLLLTVVPFEWWETQQQNRRALEMLSHYVAKPVLDELIRQNQAYSLAPTLREITVLVADMEGYTRLISTMALEDAAQLTKDFLDCLTRPVLANEGTLDKYSGDGLVAFWGAPLACDDQSDKAVEAGEAILREVELFNAGLKAAGFPRVRVRIGIESGQALVGDLGTPFRSTYTAVGDCINFASRLEAVAKNTAESLIIGPTAQGKLRRHATRSLGEITLRGVSVPILIHALSSPEA
ncbi:MAG: adenylate/guanylate cyclase domain-containing protein [Zoogloeaceae bacterium]|jgi:adenylate cyclase|nr:adenylate/guanylate cyclase domain-containing protein [Zoogloeaceae bacterium]